MTDLNLNLEQLNQKLHNLENRLNSLEQSRELEKNPNPIKNGVQITGALEIPEIQKLSLSTQKLVEIYHDVPQLLTSYAIEVTLTADSYRGNTNGEIFLERSGNTNYWVIAQDNCNYWLLPKKNFKINIHKLKSLKNLFRFPEQPLENITEFTLIKPALVSLLPNGQQWKLERLGILFLSNGSQSAQLQSALELTNQERERLQTSLEEFNQNYQKSQSQIEQLTQQISQFQQQLFQLTAQKEQELLSLLKTKFEAFQQQIQQTEEERRKLLTEFKQLYEEHQQMQLDIKQLIQPEVKQVENNLKQETNENLDISETITQPEEPKDPNDLSNNLREIAQNLTIPADTSTASVSNSASWESVKLLQTLIGHTEAVQALAISSDNQILISASFDKLIKLWKLNTGKEIGRLTGYSRFNCIAISQNQQMLVAGSDENSITIWNLFTTQKTTFTGHSDWIRSIAISPDSQTLVSGSRDNTIKIWNLQTGELLRTLTGHTGAVLALAISPDGQTFASGSEDKTIKLWKLTTGEPLCTLTEHSKEVYEVAFSSSDSNLSSSDVGLILVSGSRDHTIKIWKSL